MRATEDNMAGEFASRILGYSNLGADLGWRQQQAFYDGYTLGLKYAKSVYGGSDEN